MWQLDVFDDIGSVNVSGMELQTQCVLWDIELISLMFDCQSIIKWRTKGQIDRTNTSVS